MLNVAGYNCDGFDRNDEGSSFYRIEPSFYQLTGPDYFEIGYQMGRARMPGPFAIK